ncbi:IS110 family RNA-guided transposase [Paraburkholderia fungorum]|jgi:transposase|uniref:IS110 family transposase n=1 Tax=Paraburkholderia fungorum TaxID=134537 RepID=UPI000DB62A2D|nr:IS110 family transposase [Paraburkholderia fungorum]PZR45647.1 MAG: IS110 family transposase [Paraburkholderia fungorum]
MEIDLLGIDLAKRVFQLHGADVRGRAVYRNKVSRTALLETVRVLRPHTIAMEACGSAHHWARRFEEAGIQVRLISPHYLTPFVKTNKNDRNDAEAIVEAASRPSMNFVVVKSIEQQDMQAAHRVRELLVQQRTAIINQARGLLGERGIAIAQSPAAFRKAIPGILTETEGELTSFCQSLIMTLVQHLRALEQEIAVAEGWIRSFMDRSALCQKIAAVPGIGPITATAIVAAVGRADGFRNGRHLAAWLGLVPRQHSSGGKSQLYGISKRGDKYLRTLLIHGARSVLIRVSGKLDARSRWLQELIARRGYNRACVALANKNARIIQVLLSTEATYKPVSFADS